MLGCRTCLDNLLAGPVRCFTSLGFTQAWANPKDEHEGHAMHLNQGHQPAIRIGIVVSSAHVP